MRRFLPLLAAAALVGGGCYAGARAAADVNLAWRGHSRAELEAKLGRPRAVKPQPDGTTVLTWTHRGRTVEQLPGGSVDLEVTPTSIDFQAEVTPGVVRDVEYPIAGALVDARGTVLDFDAAWLVAGIPRGLNLRTGLVMGLSVGMGRLDDAATSLPSLQTYIGGMLGPRTALIGVYAFANGAEEGDYVHGHAWALAVQQWPAARLALRAGAAMVLDTDPGGGAELAPGAVGAVSYALVRAGSFVLDLRLDATVSIAGSFGMVGIGVNVN